MAHIRISDVDFDNNRDGDNDNRLHHEHQQTNYRSLPVSRKEMVAYFHLLPLAIRSLKWIDLEQLGDSFSGSLKKFVIISIDSFSCIYIFYFNFFSYVSMSHHYVPGC